MLWPGDISYSDDGGQVLVDVVAGTVLFLAAASFVCGERKIAETTALEMQSVIRFRAAC